MAIRSVQRVHARGPVTPEMNITPLIDVVFLLIIFFMLVNNIVAEENVPLIPPRPQDSQARTLERGEWLTVSVAPAVPPGQRQGGRPWAIPGRAEYVRVGLSAQRIAMDDLSAVTELVRRAQRQGPVNERGEPVLEVRLRADGAIEYADMQRVLAAITAAGVSDVHIVAHLPETPTPRTGD